MNIFEDLIIFEMANSHQGDIHHGLNIIKEMGKITKKYNINAAVKLQYRDLDSFIHPNVRDRSDVPHIERFLSTRLSVEQFNKLVMAIRDNGMLAMSTPFDEKSVDICVSQNLDIIKIASCSAKDWPLLEVVAKTKKPVIISTGGLSFSDMDNLYSFFQHKHSVFSMLHCVAIYPAPEEMLQLDVLDKMRKKFPDITIGYSGHENPSDVIIPAMAVAKGAKIMERHIGLPTDVIKLNSYSMNPEQADAWVNSIVHARKICSFENEKIITKQENDSLRSLMRGVYSNKVIKTGSEINSEDVFFAMPVIEGQLTSGEFKHGMIATNDYGALDPVMERKEYQDIQVLRNCVHTAKGMLNEAGIFLGEEFAIEISHHYGPKKFKEYGCIIVNIINREYCKKLIIVLPDQKHPLHYHLKKEETFQLLYGDLALSLNGYDKKLYVGEIVTVQRGDKHAFSSEKGAIFEEISSTHYRDDSFYEDEHISKQDPMLRKTFLENW